MNMEVDLTEAAVDPAADAQRSIEAICVCARAVCPVCDETYITPCKKLPRPGCRRMRNVVTGTTAVSS